MLCVECENVLSDYIDNDLSDGQRRKVEAHLTSCPRCETLRDDLARLVQASASLPLLTPSTQVWSRIEREIAAQPARVVPFLSRRFDFSVSAKQLAVAAALVFCVGLGTFYAMLPGNQGAPIAAGWQGFTTTTVTPEQLGMIQKVKELDTLKTSIGEMQRSLSARQASWTPELQGSFAKGVTDIDAEITRTTDECTRAPQDAACRARLAEAYREKLALLVVYSKLGD